MCYCVINRVDVKNAPAGYFKTDTDLRTTVSGIEVFEPQVGTTMVAA